MSALRYLLPLLLASPLPIGAQPLTSVAATQLPSAKPLTVPPQPTPDGTWSTVLDQLIATSVSAALIGSALYLGADNPEGSDRRVAGDEGYTPNANSAYVAGAYVAATVVVVWSG